MTRARLALVVVAALALSGCGLARAIYDPFGIFESRYGVEFTGFAHLDVSHRGAPPHRLVRIEFYDPATNEPLGSRDVDLAAYQVLELLDLPEGDFRVAARFDDGRTALAQPAVPQPGEVTGVVRLSNAVDADIVFVR